MHDILILLKYIINWIRVLEILQTRENKVLYIGIRGNVTDGSPFLGLVPSFSDSPFLNQFSKVPPFKMFLDIFLVPPLRKGGAHYGLWFNFRGKKYGTIKNNSFGM